MLIIIAAFVAYGVLGFLDDFVKVSMKRNLGLTALQKLALQILIAVGLAIYQSRVSVYGTTVFIPIVNKLGICVWYIPFIASYRRAVQQRQPNGHWTACIGSYFDRGNVLQSTVTYCFTTASLSALLWRGLALFFNVQQHPAKVFMGDTGSWRWAEGSRQRRL